MSLFSWFTRKSKPQAPRQRQAHTMPAPLAANGAGSAAPGRNGNGKPLLEPSASQDPAAARKNERAERRELLYTTVRDAMVRAGVLSAGYKFKVLSLDQRGAQFLVMMDLAQEYSTKLRVNAIAPGFFLTEQNRFLLTDKETGEPTQRGRTIIGHTPMGRYGTPEDLVGAVVWLASDASRFVTGIVLPVDGGFSAFSGV